jgi:hypothetical protein
MIVSQNLIWQLSTAWAPFSQKSQKSLYPNVHVPNKARAEYNSGSKATDIIGT